MYFLIEYDRSTRTTCRIETYQATERDRVDAARLALEIDLHRRKVEREVVVLDAESEAALHKTHRRYFPALSLDGLLGLGQAGAPPPPTR